MAAIGADIEDDSLLWTKCEPRLSPSALEAIDALGFRRMTPVQGAAIPAFLSHKVRFAFRVVLRRLCVGFCAVSRLVLPRFASESSGERFRN